MTKGVPFLFAGATPSRFYFIGADHWVVDSGAADTIATLRQKRYSLWQVALSYLAMPCAMLLLTTAVSLAISNSAAFWCGIVCAAAAGLPIVYIRRTEFQRLKQKPVETFVFRSDGSVEINGDIYPATRISELELEYRFYEPSDGQGDAGCSELDIVFLDGARKRRINLLSQTSNWAWKHSRKLQQLTGLPIKRVTVSS